MNGMESKRWRDLLKLIHALDKLHRELARATDAKIAAMKCADLQAMRALGKKEQLLVERIREREGLRKQLVDRMGIGLGWPEGKARSMPLRQLLSAAAGPIHAELRAAGDQLRTAMYQLAQVSRVAGAIAREVTHHMQCVFASVRPKPDDPIGYTGAGLLAAPVCSNMFDTMG